MQRDRAADERDLANAGQRGIRGLGRGGRWPGQYTGTASHLGHAAGGAGSRGRVAPGMVTVPLCSRPNASPFWIMLLLVLGRIGAWNDPASGRQAWVPGPCRTYPRRKLIMSRIAGRHT